MKVDILAELGINHGGSFEKALHMIDEASLTGVKIIKFQHYDAFKLLGPSNPYFEYAARCQFTKAQHEDLKRYCDSLGLEYLVSVFDVMDIPWADALCQRHKVATRMNQNPHFIATLLKTGKSVIISTQHPLPTAIPNVRYMYCIAEYPTPVEKLERLPCNSNLGLSSHCPSINPSLAAVAQGANLIEHHITFDRQDVGCDNSSSITFGELRQLQKFANEMVVI